MSSAWLVRLNTRSHLPTALYLKELKVRRAQLNVVSLTRDKERLTALNAFIGFDGIVTLDERLTSLPLFTVKAIRLSQFGFLFDYQPESKQKQTAQVFNFGFKADGISADIDFNAQSAGTPPRSHFSPVKLTGMSIAIGKLRSDG